MKEISYALSRSNDHKKLISREILHSRSPNRDRVVKAIQQLEHLSLSGSGTFRVREGDGGCFITEIVLAQGIVVAIIERSVFRNERCSVFDVHTGEELCALEHSRAAFICSVTYCQSKNEIMVVYKIDVPSASNVIKCRAHPLRALKAGNPYEYRNLLTDLKQTLKADMHVAEIEVDQNFVITEHFGEDNSLMVRVYCADSGPCTHAVYYIIEKEGITTLLTPDYIILVCAKSSGEAKNLAFTPGNDRLQYHFQEKDPVKFKYIRRTDGKYSHEIDVPYREGVIKWVFPIGNRFLLILEDDIVFSWNIETGIYTMMAEWNCSVMDQIVGHFLIYTPYNSCILCNGTTIAVWDFSQETPIKHRQQIAYLGQNGDSFFVDDELGVCFCYHDTIEILSVAPGIGEVGETLYKIFHNMLDCTDHNPRYIYFDKCTGELLLCEANGGRYQLYNM